MAFTALDGSGVYGTGSVVLSKALRLAPQANNHIYFGNLRPIGRIGQYRNF